MEGWGVNLEARPIIPLGPLPRRLDTVAVPYYLERQGTARSIESIGGVTMWKTLHMRATVQPGGRVEIVSPDLETGQTVEVVVLHESNVKKGRSIMEILNSGPERRLFQTAEEVKAYLAEEKASWDR